MGDCRFCGTSGGVMINIFDSVGDYVSRIEAILPLQMRASEPMPKVMCHRCMHKINDFYDFRRKCLSLDLKWRARLVSLESNSTSRPVFPVTIKLEPPDPDDSPVEITSVKKTTPPVNYGWSYTAESDLPNHGAAVIIVDKPDKPKITPVVDIEQDEQTSEDPLRISPQHSTTNNQDATSSVSRKGKAHHRRKGSPSKDHKRKRNEKKADIKDEKREETKNDKKNDRKKSIPRTAVTPATSPENPTPTVSSAKPPLQVSPNQDPQKLHLTKNPLAEKATKTPKVQKLKISLTENASASPQTSSKEPSNLTATRVKLFPEKPSATVAVKPGPKNHQKVAPAESPKPPTESEKPLPSNIIMTSIPNVCTIFTCSLCERTFTSRSLACCHNDCVKMKNNASVVENEDGGSSEGIYACSHCGMKFTRYASLVPHEETHILNNTAEDSDTLSSSSDEEMSRKRKKKRASPMQIDTVKNIANAFA